MAFSAGPASLDGVSGPLGPRRNSPPPTGPSATVMQRIGGMSRESVGVRTAVVVAGEPDTRVLRRGLLRLLHFRILGEAAGVLDALAVGWGPD